MAPKSRVMEPSCLAARRSFPVTDALPQRVLNTISEARAPSTRHGLNQLPNTNNSCLPSRAI